MAGLSWRIKPPFETVLVGSQQVDHGDHSAATNVYAMPVRLLDRDECPYRRVWPEGRRIREGHLHTTETLRVAIGRANETV